MKHFSPADSVVNLTTEQNKPIHFGSVCSGIEAASVAWDVLGWKAAWFAEIEAFPSAVLAHHWPHVQNLGDMTKIRDRISEGEVEAPDVLVGGTPCQAFSVAGAKKSLDDDRGQLTLEYVRLLNEIDATRSIRGDQPAIAVWENVPGVLNTKDNAFGCFLGALAGEECELQPSGKKWTNAGCVFGPQRAVAWRILDAQYFGVAQRRRRVFVVASAREGFNPAEVLFEPEGVRRDIAPSRGTGQKATTSTSVGFASSSFAQYRPIKGDAGTLKRSGGDLGGGSENLVTTFVDVAKCLTAKAKMRFDYETEDFVVHGTQDPITQNNIAFPLGRNQGQENTVFGIPGNWIGRKPENGGNATEPMNNIAPCQTKTDRHAVAYTLHGTPATNIMTQKETAQCLRARAPGMIENSSSTVVLSGLVRRLTPIECEILQGFPDNHTQIPYRNKSADQCPDGPRYAACGNSMAVPVMRWIGKRIANAVAESQAKK